MWAVILSLTAVMFTFTNNQQYTVSVILFIKLRAGLSAAIYQKVRKRKHLLMCAEIIISQPVPHIFGLLVFISPLSTTFQIC